MLSFIKKNYLATAILMIALGVLFIELGAGVVSLAVLVGGVILVVFGAINIFYKQLAVAIGEIILGVIAIVFRFLFANIAIYAFGAALIVYAVLELVAALQEFKGNKNKVDKILSVVNPILLLVVGVLLFLYTGETTSWLFTVGGIILIVQGVSMIVDVMCIDAGKRAIKKAVKDK